VDRKKLLATLSAIAAIIAIFAFLTGEFSLPQLFSRSSSPASNSNTSNNPTATTQAPTSTPIPTSTPVPKAGTVLYAANWSQGATGWSADPQWKILNGTLLTDGSCVEYFSAICAISAPYKIPVSNYAIESSIQVTNWGSSDSAVGLIARTQGDQGYQAAVDNNRGVITIGKDFSGFINNLGQFNGGLDSARHIWRMEVSGNVIQFFLDGRQLITVTDNSYLDPGYAGLWSIGAQIQVGSFKIIAL
jgi:hypothetical protein